MTSPLSNAQPDPNGDTLDWLSSQQPVTVSGELDRITVECQAHEFDAVITDAPPVESLTVMCKQRFTLRTAPDVRIPGKFTLRLVADDDNPTLCQVRADIGTVACSMRQRAERRRRHRLEVQSLTVVEIAGGDWHLGTHPRSEEASIWLGVDNQDEPLRISSDVAVFRVDSSGTHEFDLRASDGALQVVVEGGIATLREPIKGVTVTGEGSLRVLGSVTDSHLNMYGDVEAHGDVDNTEIYLGGDLEVLGTVTMGDHELQCNNAVLRGGLTTAAEVVCESLDVTGAVESTGSLKLGSLRCTGTLKVARLEVTGNITIAGIRHKKPHDTSRTGPSARPRRQPPA